MSPGTSEKVSMKGSHSGPRETLIISAEARISVRLTASASAR
jgi:hypothetical protein